MFKKKNLFDIEIQTSRPLVLLSTTASAILVVLLLVGLLQTNEATADGPTYVSGGIFADTAWIASQSPYIVTGTVTLFPGYTLTVEPGVEVRFDSATSLIVRGALVAEGTHSKRIVFTSNSVPTKGSWIGLKIANNQGGNASVKFANIFYAQTGLSVECCWEGGPVNISDSGFYTNNIALGGYAGWVLQVERCTFENNTYAVTGADKVISDSVFTNNEYGLFYAGRTDVDNSLFIYNEVAVGGGDAKVTHSKIISNGTGVNAELFLPINGVEPMMISAGQTLQYNTIASNTIGVVLGNFDNSPPPINYNNIYSNTEYNVKGLGPFNADVTNNWWGTTNTSVIDEYIYDGRDDASLGLVIYQPFLQGEWLPNDAPEADAQFVSTVVNIPVAITLTASDADLDPLTYLIETSPSHGSLGGTAPNLIYTPTANYSGTDSFTFTATDDHDAVSNVATVDITIVEDRSLIYLPIIMRSSG